MVMKFKELWKKMDEFIDDNIFPVSREIVALEKQYKEYQTNYHLKQIKWDRYFLKLAEQASTKSKDPSTKVGAIITDRFNTVVATGYNGFPRGVVDSKERYENRELKYKLVVHAELNACLIAGKEARGGTIYVTPTLMVPNACPECCKAIIQSGIKRVVGWNSDTLSDRWQELAALSKLMLSEASVNWDLINKE